jgi:hypothetical protein
MSLSVQLSRLHELSLMDWQAEQLAYPVCLGSPALEASLPVQRVCRKAVCFCSAVTSSYYLLCSTCVILPQSGFG